MCVDHRSIDMQSYHYADLIRNCTIYKPLRLEFIGGPSVPIESGEALPMDSQYVVSSIILEDRDGQIFEIELNEYGLDFASGKLTYKEYVNLRKKGNRQLISIFAASAGGLILAGFAMVKFLL